MDRFAGPALLGLAQRLASQLAGCAAARAARRRAGRRRARPDARRSPRPRQEFRARSARSRDWRRSTRWPPSSSHRSPPPRPTPARLPREPQHAGEHLAQRLLVPAAELGDRRVIRSEVAGHNAIRDVLDARALDPTRRPVRARRHRATAPPSSTAHRPADRARHRGNPRRSPTDLTPPRFQHRPHQMPLGHPIAKRRRHQEHLIPVTTDEPRAHSVRLPSRPDELPDSLA
jgi:hypothetical protein